jgi:hypothetical protein
MGGGFDGWPHSMPQFLLAFTAKSWAALLGAEG